MITSIGQVMLYVNDTQASKDFWVNQVGFVLKGQIDLPNQIVAYVIAPQENSEVEFVLHDKAFLKEMSPELDLTFPSILMKSNNLEATYKQLVANGVHANPIQDIGFKTFNFSDNEGNYFAIRQM